jgi:hypothetical protein
MEVHVRPQPHGALSRAWALGLALLLGALGTARADNAAAHAAIRADDLKHTVEVLASDEFQGREGGSEGNRKAGEWLAAEIQKIGLAPAGDGGTYFQNFKSPADGRPLRNIVATLPAREGSDVADEVLVLGSHYDHVGLGRSGALDFLKGRGKIHHGADDNASGSAGNLALARAFAAAGPARRRIVFVWFDGEELGLFGSLHYVKAPAFPLKNTVAMLNMDMIGRARNKKLIVYGLNTGSTFGTIFYDNAKSSGLKIDEHEALPPNSDYYSFYQKKVPVIALFTGLHKDYHRATDTSDKIVADGMESIARLAYDVTRGLAEADGRPTFAKAKPGGEAEAMFEQLQSMLSDEDLGSLFGGEEKMNELFKQGGLDKILEKLRGRSRPRLGVQIATEPDTDGVRVVSVVKGSVAEKAGVGKDDLIIAIGDRETGDYDTLMNAIRAAKGRTKITVERDGKRLELEAEFPGEAKRDGEKRWF